MRPGNLGKLGKLGNLKQSPYARGRFYLGQTEINSPPPLVDWDQVPELPEVPGPFRPRQTSFARLTPSVSHSSCAAATSNGRPIANQQQLFWPGFAPISPS